MLNNITRAYQFISEAPIADFEVFASPEDMKFGLDRGFWHPSDAKLYKSEKAIKKIHNVFSKTPYNFNLYIVPAGVSGRITKDEFEKNLKN